MTQRQRISRVSSVTESVVATNSASTSPSVMFGAVAGGLLVVDAVAGGASKISWYTHLEPSDTAVPVYADGQAVETDVQAGRAYPLPDAVFAGQFLKAVTNAGTVTFRISVKG